MNDSPHQPQRLAGYAGAISVFATATAVAVLAARRTDSVPTRYEPLDLVLGSIAAHKLARIIAKEGVAAPLRAPFTEFDGVAGSAEVDEHPRDGHGHTVGELLTCPFCLGPWIASGYVAALALAPSMARAWAATFSVVGGADFLQQAYARVRTD